ncbi:GNAT family N-acetyltransferase [Paenibacillus glacialis]|uniref:Acetyltransferase n=1 Tax=Paenibacillus glacialis TaxID=494026 RepID=A0A168LMY3_9BACL|nr:GNAT family protein [Paenibacillus glacialis]OAB43614.1 acetyltransferase [Paenibacillus glacialis]
MNLTFYDTISGIYLRPLQKDDSRSLLDLRILTRSVYAAYEPRQYESFYTLHEQQQLILRRIHDAENDHAYMFGIFNMNGKLIGQITLSNVVRGVGQFADVGYFIDPEEKNKGYMTAALHLILKYSFQSLALHRIQAAILLDNQPSRRVLEKVGFQPEGIARQFIKINDQWQDHQTFAILADEYPIANTSK